jgi:hypothetical protein
MNTGWWFLTFPCNVKFCTYKYMFMLDHHIPKTWKIQTTSVYIYIYILWRQHGAHGFPFLRLFDAQASLNMQLGGAFVQF